MYCVFLQFVFGFSDSNSLLTVGKVTHYMKNLITEQFVIMDNSFSRMTQREVETSILLYCVHRNHKVYELTK